MPESHVSRGPSTAHTSSLRFYKDLSEQQALLISGLKAEIAGLRTQVSSLSAQTDTYRDALRRLEQGIPVEKVSQSASSDGTIIKQGAAEDGLPVEDLGQPRRAALALRSAPKIEYKKETSVWSTGRGGKGPPTQAVDTTTMIMGLDITEEPHSPSREDIDHRGPSLSRGVTEDDALEIAVKREWEDGVPPPRTTDGKRLRLRPEVVISQSNRRMRSMSSTNATPEEVHPSLPRPGNSGEHSYRIDIDAQLYGSNTILTNSQSSAPDPYQRQQTQEAAGNLGGGPPTNESYVHARLRGVPSFPITIDPSVRDVKVSREYMSKTFGGTYRVMSVKYTDRNREEHNHTYSHSFFPKVAINWNAPRKPGDPGVFFLAKPEPLWPDGPQKLMVGLGDAQFCYMGEYSFTMTYPMSPQEFKALPDKIRRRWGRNLCQDPHHRELRARLFLRDRFGRIASENEVAKALATTDIYKIEPNKIVEAYETGFIVMYVWNMECIGYDEGFARRIATPLLAQSKRSKGPRGGNTARAKRRATTMTSEEASVGSGSDDDFSDAET
ncbi:hypothetical protein C8Q79DRAFT_713128 [Trametes meyenii]|nr:hypothetical protein C8Q79DRAFT_713128 [Trametes meyenii]